MRNEKLNNSLSAMMDNAADDLEIRRVLANTDDEIMATWTRYQMARSVMHNEVIFPSLNIASAVSEAIAKECVEAKPANVASVKQIFGLWGSIGKVAVAASILAITLSTAYFLNDDDITDVSTTVYANNAEGMVDLNVASSEPQIDLKIAELIDKHEKHGLLTIEENEFKASELVE